MEGAFAGLRVGEIVSGLLDDRSEASTEIVEDNVEIASVVRYDPGSYTRIPNGKIKCQYKLDVGVVFGHAKNKATGGNFDGDGVAASGNVKEGWIKGLGDHNRLFKITYYLNVYRLGFVGFD